MRSSSESSKASSVSSDQENGVSDFENQSNIQSRNIDDDESQSEESGDEGKDGEPVKAVTTRDGKKRERQEADDELNDEEDSSKVLSHAEKRRQKKWEHQKSKASALAGEKSGAADVSTAGSSRRQNSVWVGNLLYKTTVDELKTFFARVGEITRINMPTKAAAGPGRKAENRGFAYVDFATPEAKTCAIALSEQPLIGRKLLIKDGDDFTGRPQPVVDSNVTGDTDRAAAPKTYSKTAQKILRAQKQPPGPTLFFGNLGFETTEADIIEMLNAHRIPSAGRQQKMDNLTVKDKSKPPFSIQSNSYIRKVRMGTFEDSGLCKGFAFVDFMSTEDASSALTNPKNFFLNGRKLVIEYASPDAVRRGAPKSPGRAPRSVGGDKVGRRQKSLLIDGKTPKTVKQSARVEGEGDEAKSLERPSKRQRVDEVNTLPARVQRTLKKGPKPRIKPGASLASAQRESVAIIPSQGKKIKFD